MTNGVVANAATIKLSATKKKLGVGDSFKLKVKGTSEKATFASSKKSVATVNAKGKVTAKKAGTATITATVAGKELTCKVTVSTTKTMKLDGASTLIPSNWKVLTEEAAGIKAYVIIPKDADVENTSSIQCMALDAGMEEDAFDFYYEAIKLQMTEELLEGQVAGFGVEVSIEDLEIEKVKLGNNQAVKISHIIIADGNEISQDTYHVLGNGLLVQISTAEVGAETKPSVSDVAEMMVKNLKFK